MKKQVSKLMSLGLGLALVFAVSSCAKDAEVENAATLKSGSSACGAPDTYILHVSQSIDDWGAVTITNDATNFYVKYFSFHNEAINQIHFWFGTSMKNAPMNKQGVPVPGQFPYNITLDPNTSEYTLTIPIPAGMACGNAFYFIAHATMDGASAFAGNMGGDVKRWYFYDTYTIKCCDLKYHSETAFALGNISFCDLGLSRWGWENGPLSEGTYTYDVYAAAGQCDTEKGVYAGSLVVDYQGGKVTATYQLLPGFTVLENHLYVGTSPEPASGYVANGKYGYKAGQEISITGDIYVIAHAVVAWYE